MLREGDGEWLYRDKWKIKMVMANKNTINEIKKILANYVFELKFKYIYIAKNYFIGILKANLWAHLVV